MTVELGEKTPDAPEEAEKQHPEELLTAKELRLPVGVRRRIRRLKEQGMQEKAIGYRRGEVEKAIRKRKGKTKMQKAEEILDETIKQIVESDDPEKQGESLATATWLADFVGESTAEERAEDLSKILQEHPELEGKLSSIRDKVLEIKV